MSIVFSGYYVYLKIHKYRGNAPGLQVLSDEGASMFEGLFVPAAYLAGSISSAIIVCRLMGLPDPRGQGSGNPGATNVMRIGGKKSGRNYPVG